MKVRRNKPADGEAELRRWYNDGLNAAVNCVAALQMSLLGEGRECCHNTLAVLGKRIEDMKLPEGKP